MVRRGSDPTAARNFYHSFNGEIVLKALHHHSVEIRENIYSMYSHIISIQDLERFDDLVYAPCILQERIHKRSELRATVVGEQVFAAILSHSGKGEYDDIHRHRLSGLQKRAVRLHKSISNRCVKIINSLGLRYGAIDFIVDENDQLNFLEINPNGDWYWIEQETKLPITEAMTAMIERFARF